MKKRNLLLLAFFASGATGLIYEVIWARQLGLVFGTSVYATASVLAVFFSGLAFGSYLFGKLVDKFEKPLKLYGLVELLIGIYAFITPSLFKFVELLQTSLNFNLNFGKMSIVRLILSFFLLIIPTTLIGGTLPVMIKYFSKNKSFGKQTSKLYGINTLGAVFGTVLAGFFLISTFGIKTTNLVAVITNIFIGVVVLKSTNGIEIGIKKVGKKLESGMKIEGKKNLILWGLFFSGLSALALEVLWTRMLVLVIGVSTYAFSIVLITFLVGISLGSFLIGKVIEKINPLKTFITLEFLRGVLVIALIPVFGWLPFWYLEIINKLGWSFNAGITVSFGITFLILLVPTILMGMTFPVVVKIIGKNYKNLGESVGRVYFFNTLGGVVGSILAGFVLVPILGVQKSMVLIAGIYFAVAIILSKIKKNIGILALSILFVGLLLPNWNEKILSSGLYDYGPAYLKLSKKEFERYSKEKELLFYKEGISSLIGVTRQGNQLSLLVNGKSQSSSVSDIKPQLMLGHLPMLLQENPKKVLVVGMGTGMTLGAIEKYDTLEEVVAVEIEPEVVEAAEFFEGVNGNALIDKRLTIEIEDGRNYLLTTKNKFDVISSQPSNLWIKGMGNLHTKEYFEIAREKLTENGVMIQWVQLNTISNEDLKSIVKTFRSVFPEVSLWETIYSMYLVGSNTSFDEIDIERLKIIDANTAIKKDMLRMGIDSQKTFLGHFVTSGEEVLKWSGEVRLHTDDMPFLEFNTPKSFYNHEKTLVENLLSISELRENSTNIFVNKNEYEYRGNLIKAEIAFAKDNLKEAQRYFGEAARLKPDSEEAKKSLNYVNFLLRN